MTPEMWTIIGVGLALGGFQWHMGDKVDGLKYEVSGLRERMAKLEGLFEVFVQKPKEPAE